MDGWLDNERWVGRQPHKRLRAKEEGGEGSFRLPSHVGVQRGGFRDMRRENGEKISNFYLICSM
jgi:hypothetical protein